MGRDQNPKFLNTIIVLAIILTIGIVIFLIGFPYPYDYRNGPPQLETLVIGTSTGPSDLDPTDSWDSASNDVIEQVVETLFIYDTRQYVLDETMPRVNWLANDFSWDITNTILTVNIRVGIFFHDGTAMDAAAVAWSFNRLMYLMNHTGELPSDGTVVKIHSLYEFPDGTPIFQSVVATDIDTVVFTLNAPYAPIIDAMCYISCGILSPSSTPATSIIDLETDDLVGTGPYMYDYFIGDAEIRFTKFEDYWATQAPYNLEDDVMFDAMVYSVIDDSPTRNYAMLAGDIDILFGSMTDLLPAFRANVWIHVEEIEVPGLVYNYLAFNNERINVTWRKAMSYSINYTYIIEDLLNNEAFRSFGPISAGFGDAYDSSINVTAPYYNVTYAREVIINNIPGATGRDPLNFSDWGLGANTLITFNYSYNIDDEFRMALYPLLRTWFANISIDVIDGGTDWGYFLLRAYGYVPGGFDDLELFWLQMTPEFFDPIRMFFPLFSNMSQWNSGQVNDFRLEAMLIDILTTTNDTLRNEIYHNISHYIAEELYPHAFGYHPKLYNVHAADLYDFPYNPGDKFLAYPIKRNFTWGPPS